MIKKLNKLMKWYKERVFNYLIHSLLYYVFYKVSGFELANNCAWTNNW